MTEKSTSELSINIENLIDVIQKQSKTIDLLRAETKEELKDLDSKLENYYREMNSRFVSFQNDYALKSELASAGARIEKTIGLQFENEDLRKEIIQNSIDDSKKRLKFLEDERSKIVYLLISSFILAGLGLIFSTDVL